jgi:hypothetical protein
MALRPWLEKSNVLADALAELHWHFECGQMAAYAQNCMAQVETALNFHAAELNAMPKAIRDGSMPIPAPKPTPIAPLPPAVTQEPPFNYHPLKGAPTFKGAVVGSPKIDPTLASPRSKDKIEGYLRFRAETDHLTQREFEQLGDVEPAVDLDGSILERDRGI